MNVLDSPLEVLAFNYLSFSSNNLWTCLALITAALSFWKIRSSSTHPKPIPEYNPVPTTTEPVTEVVVPEPVSGRTKQPLLKPVVLTEDTDGVRKGKFTVYYDDEEEEEVQCGCEKMEGLLTMTVTDEWDGGESEWWGKWETVLRLRNGENEKGWHTCQDLSELNGNVVRLWDGGLRFQSRGIHVW